RSGGLLPPQVAVQTNIRLSLFCGLDLALGFYPSRLYVCLRSNRRPPRLRSPLPLLFGPSFSFSFSLGFPLGILCVYLYLSFGRYIHTDAVVIVLPISRTRGSYHRCQHYKPDLHATLSIFRLTTKLADVL